MVLAGWLQCGTIETMHTFMTLQCDAETIMAVSFMRVARGSREQAPSAGQTGQDFFLLSQMLALW